MPVSSVLKGQLISKANCQAEDSLKKRTNEFVFTSMRIVFVRFWKNPRPEKKKRFEIIWPLVREKKIIDHFAVIKYWPGLILLIKILGFWTELPFVTTFGKKVTFCTPNSFGNSISINPPIDPLKAIANR